MKIFFLFAVVFLCLASSGRAQGPMLPDVPPLLQIFEPRVTNAEMNQLSYDAKHPLLTVREVPEMHLAQDNKGVLLVLKEDDAKTFAAITREFEGRPLMFKAVDGTVRPITIQSAVEDGKVGFKYPEAEPLAKDYRQHFHLGEFSSR